MLLNQDTKRNLIMLVGVGALIGGFLMLFIITALTIFSIFFGAIFPSLYKLFHTLVDYYPLPLVLFIEFLAGSIMGALIGYIRFRIMVKESGIQTNVDQYQQARLNWSLISVTLITIGIFTTIWPFFFKEVVSNPFYSILSFYPHSLIPFFAFLGALIALTVGIIFSSISRKFKAYGIRNFIIIFFLSFLLLMIIQYEIRINAIRML